MIQKRNKGLMATLLREPCLSQTAELGGRAGRTPTASGPSARLRGRTCGFHVSGRKTSTLLKTHMDMSYSKMESTVFPG